MAAKKSETLILLSGGIDSTACLNFYLEEKHNVKAVLVNYGQVAFKKELVAVKAICNYFSVNYKIVTVKAKLPNKSGLVMGRNMFLLSTALVYGEVESGFISTGLHSGTNYSDCSEVFVDRMRSLFEIYTHGRLQIGTPFIKWSKGEIWRYCKMKKVPLELTYSCELGLKQPCTKCSSCKDLIKLNAG